ncbi:MAG: ATP-dependent helicase HrpB [Pseudomonadota bacterium]
MVARYSSQLPIEDALPDLLAALNAGPSAVLVAPPGAGKTTRVPLALLNADWLDDGKIIVLEPRRLAARAAAKRMAQTLGEKLGDTVGLRVRFENKTSARTRIEVVTEGVFTAMVVNDPELTGVAAVLFDEFHERSLDADFGLALSLESQAALRPDLRLLVMSATLDGGRVAGLLGYGAPVVESRGRAHPVELRHRPVGTNETVIDAAVAAVKSAFASETGSLLVFLPGAAEIRRAAERLSTAFKDTNEIIVAPLYGALSPAEQDLAITPAPQGSRKIVLATPIAESSITIEGVRVVIDSGQVRQPVFEPALGATRLVTRRASQASVDQRMGRAGRTEPGVCIRLWPEAQTASLPAFAPPEVETADLAPLLLRSALFGERDPERLRWLDPLPKAHLAQARTDLLALGALTEDGTITPKGQALGAMPLPVREAAMVVAAANYGPQCTQDAALLAVLLGERGLGGNGVDLAARLEAIKTRPGPRGKQAQQLARRIAQQAEQFASDPAKSHELSAGVLLSLGFPDRIAQRRGERDGQVRYRMANGRAISVDGTDALGREPFLVATDFQGRADAARLTNGAAISEADIRLHHADRLRTQPHIELASADTSVQGVVRQALGAVVLGERSIEPAELREAASALLMERLADYGADVLPWAKRSERLMDRLTFAARNDGVYQPVADIKSTDLAFLQDALTGCRAYGEVSPDKLHACLEAEIVERLGWQLWSSLNEIAPVQFQPAAGQAVPIDYSGPQPTVAVKPQQMFGVTEHPTIGQRRVPLMFSLLSPAGRPIQTTQDLPGLWAGSWQDVRRDLRGRYPKHDWPENPATAEPTARAKPRA